MPLDGDVVFIFDDFQDFAVEHGVDFAPIDHAFAGNADDDQLLPLNLVFDNVGDDVAGVAAFGNDADFFGAIGQVVGQIDPAIAVPYQVLQIFRGPGEIGFVHHRQGAPAKPNDYIHFALFEQPGGNFPYFFSITCHVKQPQPLLLRKIDLVRGPLFFR